MNLSSSHVFLACFKPRCVGSSPLHLWGSFGMFVFFFPFKKRVSTPPSLACEADASSVLKPAVLVGPALGLLHFPRNAAFGPAFMATSPL